MGGNRMRKFRMVSIAGALALTLAIPGTAFGAIHEIIGAACRAGGEEVIPPGQVAFDKQSALRALQATGVIESITDVGGDVTVTFDLSRPNSKYVSAGFDLTIPDAFGPGDDLTLSPLPVLDTTFAAHANCRNLNP